MGGGGGGANAVVIAGELQQRQSAGAGEEVLEKEGILTLYMAASLKISNISCEKKLHKNFW